MASKRKNGRAASRGRGPKRARASNGGDAIALLKTDHREVESFFEQFEKARSDDRKQELADKICNGLKAHTTIEEEIFYPAFLAATDETDLHHEAAVEHDGAKKLIAEIEASSPNDEYFDARVTVLSEMIKHHVKEEEQRDGMFAKARDSDMDLESLGDQLKRRKAELLGKEAPRRAGDKAPAALLGRERAQPVGVVRRPS